MRPSGSMRAQIGTLILATSGIQLANGFFNTLISLRVAIEDFEPTMSGLVLSSYFAGFTLAAMRCGRIIERVGHIRAYAAFAGLVVAATAAMPFLVGALPWLVLRAVVGFGCAGIFITTESWLNAKAPPSERGRVFSVYMVGTFVALAVGQLLIGRAKIETAAARQVRGSGQPGRLGPHGIATASGEALRDLSAAGDAAGARSTRRQRRAPVAGPCGAGSRGRPIPVTVPAPTATCWAVHKFLQ